MYEFHVTLHADTKGTQTYDAKQKIGQHEVLPLAVSSLSLDQPFSVSFEEAHEALSKLERMFCEPDGSFYWSGINDREDWKVEGNVYDRAGRLIYVELWGCCPPASFDQMLSAFGWPQTSVIFQLVRLALYLDENQFRQIAQRNK